MTRWRFAVLLLTLLGIAGPAVAQPTPVRVSPATLRFGQQPLGTASDPLTVSIRNNQTIPLAIAAITISGEFTVSSGCPASLPASATCNVLVRFAPTVATAASGTLTISHSASTSPQTVALTGTGIDPVRVSPTSLVFTDRAVFTTSTAKTITVTNRLPQALTISGIQVNGDFAFSTTCRSSLAAGAQCIVDVTFTPTVVGQRTGNITITHSAVNSPQMVSLSGIGTASGLRSLAVSPVNTSIPLGRTQQFSVVGTFASGASYDLTSSATWTSSLPSVADFNGAPGLASTLSTGSTTISARVDTTVGSTTLNVLPAALVTVAVTPASPVLEVWAPQQLTATGTYTDGSTQNLTAAASWTSADATVATVQNGAGAGLATGIAGGSTTISGTVDGVSGSAAVSVVTPPRISRFVYAGNTGGLSISGYSMDAVRGSLTPTPGSPYAGSTSTAVVIDPLERVLFVGNSGSVQVWTIEPDTGRLAVLQTVPVSGNVTALATDRLGTRLFVGLFEPRLLVFDIDPNTGALVAATGSPFPVASLTQDLSVHPNGTFIYLAHSSGTVSAYRFDSTTGLQTIGGSPFAGGSVLRGIRVHPSGRFLFAVGRAASGPAIQGAVLGYAIDPVTGMLAPLPGSPRLTADDLSALTALDTHIYVSGNFGAHAYSVDRVTGAVVPVVGEPFGVCANAARITVDQSGRFLLCANGSVGSSPNTVSAHAITLPAGTLAAVAGSPFPAANNPRSVTAGGRRIDPAATLVALSVSPVAPSASIGAAVQFTLRGTYSDGSTRFLTASATWSSSSPSVASISNAPADAGRAAALAAGTTTIGAAFGGLTAQSTLTVQGATLISIAIAPVNPSAPLGTTRQLTAVGSFSDASTQDLTASVVWSSSAVGVATISNAAGTQGLVSTVSLGTATITATLNGVTGTTQLTVAPPIIASIAIQPVNPSVPLGRQLGFLAIATMTDASFQDVTTTATWSSSVPAVATISNAAGTRGLASTLAEGPTVISATLNGITGTTTLTVVPAIVNSIALSPAQTTIAAGRTQAFTAAATYTDGRTEDVTGAIVWESTSALLLSVSTSGVVTGLHVGSGQVLGRLAGSDAIGSAIVDVRPAVVDAIAVTPVNPSVPAGRTQQFTATATYSDGTSRALTSSGSDSFDVAYVSDYVVRRTTGFGIGSMMAIVNTGAQPLDLSTIQIVSVTDDHPDAVLDFVVQIPSSTVLAPGAAAGALSSMATGLLISSGLVTETWTDQSTPYFGLGITNLPQGTSATIHGSVVLRIGTQQVTLPVSIHYSDDPGADFEFAPDRRVMTPATWSASLPSVATISNLSASYGLASALAPGASTITATSGPVSGSTTLSVSAPVLVSMAVAPAIVSTPLGIAQQFTAVGTYSDGSSQDITNAVTWASSATSFATISNTAGSQGLATPVAVGITTISATLSGVSGQASLTVTAAILQSVVVAPATTSVAVGRTQQFTATGVYSDGSQSDVTAAASWTSSDPGKVLVSDAAGTRGLAVGVATGGATITATVGLVSGSANINVTHQTTSPKFAYVVNRNSNSISAFMVDDRLGTLTPIAGNFQTGPNPQDVVTTSSGRFVYASNGPGTVSGFAVDPATGALQPLPGSPFTTGLGSVSALAVDPQDRFLFAVNSGSAGIAAFTVAADGRLTSVTGSPFPAPAVVFGDLAVHPSGRFVYSTSTATDAIHVHVINQITGALTFMPSGTVPAGAQPRGIAFSPSGQVGYVSDEISGQIRSYFVDVFTGLLTPTPAPVGQTGTNVQEVAVDPLGRFVYVASTVSGQVYAFRTDGFGALTPVPGSPFATHAGTAALDVSEQFVLTANLYGHSADAFTINQIAGSLTRAAGSPFAAGQSPVEVATARIPISSGATLVSLAIAPLTADLTVGDIRQFTAVGTYSDGTTRFLTASATWTSSFPGVASAGNAPGTKGRITALAAGTTSITALVDSIPATATVNVTALPPVIVSVQPNTGAQGQTLNVAVSGQFTNFVQGQTTASFGANITVNSVTVTSATAATINITIGPAAALGARTVTMTTGAEVVSAPAAFSVTQPVLLLISVTPSLPSVPLGLGQQFTATGTYDNGATVDITGAVTWTSSLPAVATIDAAGLASSVSIGSSSIVATIGAISGGTTLTVGPPQLTALAIAPAHASIVEGQTQQFTVTGTYTDGSTQNLTASAAWSTSDVAIATINAAGLAGGIGAGLATVTATSSAISASARIYVRRAAAPQFAFVANHSGTVSAYTVDAIAGVLTPVNGTPFVTGTFPWGVAVTPDNRFVYVSNEGSHSVSGYSIDVQTGVLTPVPGSPFASPALPRGLVVHPSGRFIYVANSGSGRVSGYAIDQTTGTLTPAPVTSLVIGGSPGAIAAHPSGAFVYVISATTNTVMAIAVNQITGVLTPIAAEPVGASPIAIAIDPTGRFAYVSADGVPGAIRGYAIDAGTGTLAPLPPNPVLNNFLPYGLAAHPDGRVIYATQLSGQQFAGFSIDDATGALAPLPGAPFAGASSVGLALDPSGRFAYLPAWTASAVTGSALSESGVPVAMAGSPFATAGTSRMMDIGGVPSALNATLTSLEVRPATASVQAGGVVQFTARGIYSDGSARFLTASSTWTSSEAAVASMSNVAGSNGRATALTPGLTIVTATFNGISGTAMLTVTAAPLVSIAVTPADQTIQAGTQLQFVATGTYADNSTQDLTSSATWSSSVPTVATISNAVASRGRADGIDPGQTMIAATFDGVTGSTLLNVSPGAPSILTLQPDQGARGQTLTLLVTGRFTNFVQNQTTASLGADITVNSVTVVGPTSATVNVSIALGASTGPRSLTMTTGSETVTASFIILPAAELTAITPDNGQQGQTLDVAIGGVNTHFVQGQTIVTFGADIAVTSVQVTSATSLTATLAIGVNAVASPRTITVITGSETVALVDGFTVLSSVAQLTSILPVNGRQGESLTVQISGQNTHFVQGQTTATFGQGISIQSITVNSPTSATIAIVIDPLAGTGGRAVTLATGTEFATQSSGFAVLAGPAHLDAFAPTTARQGDSVTVQVTGVDTHFAQSATTATFGPDITIGNVQILSPTSATVDIAVDPAATLGLRTVRLTTGGEIASNADRFQVLPGIPQVASITPNTGAQGASVTVQITARFTHFVQGTTNVSFGAGVFVSSFSVTSPTTATATLDISPTTVAGGRDVTLTTGGEIVTASGGFTVQAGPAVITQITPSTATQGDTLTVDITGEFTHFAEGVTVAGFAPPTPSVSIQVLSLTVNSPTSATAQIQIPALAVPGVWSISLSTSGEVASRTNAFTVLPGTPILVDVSPSSVAQGQTQDVVVTGRFTQFVQNQTTASFGAGVTVNSVTVTSATTATVNVTVDVLAFTGLRTIVVTTGPQVLTLTNRFAVAPGPARITAVVPNQAQQGQSVAIDITGADTHFQQGVTSLSLAGATVTSLTVTSATTASAVIAIAPLVQPGLYSLTMTTSGENASLATAFTILPGTPVITAVAPAFGQQGQALDIDVTGAFTHFVQGQTTANFGTGITTNTVTVTGPTTATVNVTIDPLTVVGIRDVTLTTGAETAVGPLQFTVVPGIAILTSLSPAEGQQGQTLDVFITGRDTHFAAGVTTPQFGADVTVNSFTVSSPTQAVANITIDPLAGIGLRSVTLKTLGESAERTNGFNVRAGTPIVTSITPSSGRQGESVTVNILGQYTNFQPGLTVADFGAGVTVVSLTITGPTSATASLTIDPITPVGGRSVTLTTGAEIATGGSFSILPGTAVLTQVSPDNARQGQSVTVNVVGLNTHFASGQTSAAVSGSGASAGPVTVTTPTTASFTIVLEPFATPGPRSVTLTTAGEIASIVDGFTVVAGTPRISTVVPASGTQGQTLSVTITGQFTNFQQNVTSIALGAGIQVTSVTVSSPTSATASISIDPLASTGGRTITATTGSEVAASAAGAFVVQAGAAALSALTPNAGRQGEAVTVQITGSGTHFLAGTSLADFGAGIVVTGLTVTSPTQATASISIAASAVLGTRNVTVTTAGETARIDNGFTVLVGTARVIQINPVTGRQAETLNVTITGEFTNFVQGQTTASFGAGITTTAVAVASPTSAVATIAVQPSAALGARSVTVTTGSEVAVSVVGFTVTPGQAAVAAVTPNTGVQGQSLTVAIAGQFTSFAPGATTVSFGGGISVGAVTVNGPTQLTVPISVAAGATTGPRTATVTTGSETAILAGAFTVTAGSPTITIINPNVGGPNSNVAVQITGQFTNFAAGQTVASFGPNISVGGGPVGAAGPVTVSGPTTATAQLAIQTGAPLGSRDVVVQTGSETITVFGGFTVTTADSTPPGVFRVSPAANAIDVPINAEAVVEFNEPLERASVTPTSIGLRDGTDASIVPATVVLDATGRIATVTPTALLAVNRSYSIAVSFNTRIRDAAGNQMNPATAASFTTGLSTDTTGPSLLVASPGSGAAAVPLNTDVVLQFSKPINPVTRAGVQLLVSGTPVPGALTFSTDNRVLTFQPTANLSANTQYAVLVTNQLTDVAGNPVANPGTLLFTSGSASDTISPQVVAIRPQTGSDNIGVNVVPEVTFSERINPVTVRAETVQLIYSHTGARVPTMLTVAADRLSATLTPSEPLTASASYQLTISSITDLAGNAIPFASASFTTAITGDTAGPGVTDVSPVSGSVDVPVNARIALRLSEPIGTASLQPGTIALVPSGGSAVSGALSASTDRRTVFFTPGASLTASTDYAIAVTGLRDDTGNLMTPFGSAFRTRSSTAIDTTGPSVTAVSPIASQTGVNVNAPVILTFSEAVDPTTVDAGITISVSGQSGEIAGTFTLNGGVVTFAPLAAWPGDTVISVTAGSAVRDLAGNGGQFFSSTFRTAAVADTTPPTVLSVVPGNGTTDVGPRADVVLTFSESLKASTVSSATFGLFADGDWLSASVTRSSDNRQVTLSATLPADRVVTVVATADVTDLSGNRLSDFSSSFSTAATPDTGRPSIVRQRPGLGVSGVRADTPIVLYADEPLDPATVPGALFVAADGILISGSTVVSGGGQTITFTPDAPFAAGTHVEIFVEPTATDVAGNLLMTYQGNYNVAVDPATTAPTLVRTNPTTGGDVPRNVRVELEFSEALAPATVTGNVFLRENGSTPVAASVTVERGGRVIRISPSAELHPNTFYSYQVTTGVRDLQGTPLGFTISGGFTTGATSHVDAPTVVSVSPPAGATGVGVTADIHVEFSEAVNPISVTTSTIAVLDGNGAIFSHSIVFSEQDHAVTIVPHRALAASQVIQVVINGVEDVAGNLVVPHTSTFVTGPGPDVTAPAILRSNPFSSESNVPVNSLITLEFTEPLDPTSVADGTLLIDNSTGLPVNVIRSLSLDRRTVTMQPVSALAVSRSYSSRLQSGLKDLAGNRAFFASYSFTTALTPDGAAPLVVSTNPRNGATGVPINVQLGIEFSEPVAAFSFGQLVLRAGGQTVPASISVSDANRRLTISPHVPLLGMTAYVLTIAGVSDLSGNSVAAQTLSFTTAGGADLINPTASIVIPQSGAENVGTNAVVLVHFSERVNPISVNATGFRLLNEGSFVVPATIALAPDSLSATLTPLVPLRPFLRYTVQVTSAVTDLVNRAVSFTSSSFTTGAGSDTSAPVVLAVSPASGTTGVPLNTQVVIRLSDPIATISVQPGTISLVPSGGSAASGVLSLATDRRTLTFTPSAALLASTSYTVTVSGLADDTGNPVSAFSSGFTTRASATLDTIGPAVQSHSPGSASAVAVTTPIVITFSEPVDPISASGVSIQVAGQTGDIAGAFTVNGATVTFTPLTPWPGNTDIRTTVGSNAVRDFAGNGSSFFSVTFRTAAVSDTTAPAVLSVSPLNGASDIGPWADVVLTFSESLSASTISNSTFGLFANDAWLNPSVVRSSDNRSVTLSATLPPSSVITVVATGDVTDLSGNHLPDFRSSFTTASAQEFTRPSISRQRPATGTSGVRGDVPIVLYADEPLAVGTVPSAVFVAADGVLVAGNTTVSAGGQVITFVPTAALPAGATIEVFVEPSATDVSGNSLFRYQGTFIVAADPLTAAPTFVDRNPSGAFSVPRNTRLELEFSEPLDPGSVNDATVLFRDGFGVVVPSAISLVRDGRVIRVTPSVLLSPSTFYSFQVTTGVRDLQGTPTAFTSGGFTTSDVTDMTAPTVAGMSPPDGSLGVGVNATIRIELDESVNPLSVNAQTLAVSDSSGALLASSMAFSDQDRAITFFPHRALASGQIIQIAVNGIEDVAGNPVVPRTTTFTTRIGTDVAGPTVVSASPFPGQVNVAVNAVAAVEFSEPIDPTSIAGVELRDNQTGTLVPVSRTLSADATQIALQPLSPLMPSHGYSLRVVNTLRDLAGNAFGFANYTFTTDSATDAIAPVVVGTSPPDGATGVPINALLTVQFDEPVAASALGQVVLRTGGQPVAATLTLSDSNRRLTITPTVPLLGLATYTLTLAGVADPSGNVAPTQSISFITAIGPDLRNPDVVNYTPTAGSTGVPLNTVITIQFSERVNPLTVTSSTFRLLQNGSVQIAGTIVVAADGLSATLTPSVPLQPFTSYTIQTNGIVDLVGRVTSFENNAFTTGGSEP